MTTPLSGSLIIQNGKLVGVQCLQSKLAMERSGIWSLHVLINDPTTGYGIFIEKKTLTKSDEAFNNFTTGYDIFLENMLVNMPMPAR